MMPQYDYLNIGVTLIRTLFVNSNKKAIEALDAALVEANKIAGVTENEKNPKPLVVRVGNVEQAIPHTNSPRYNNGSLINEYLQIDLLPEDLVTKITNLHHQKELQQDTFNKAAQAIIECCICMLQHVPQEELRIELFILLFSDYIWKDKDLAKSLEDIENFIKYYANYSDIYTNHSSEIESCLEKLDPDSEKRNIIKDFTDIYYGMDLFDNF